MDRLAGLNLAGEDDDGYLLQSLSPELAIELLDPKLSREAKHAFELAKGVLILACLLIEMVSKRSEAVGPVSGVAGPLLQAQILLRDGEFGGVRELKIGRHAANVQVSSDAPASLRCGQTSSLRRSVRLRWEAVVVQLQHLQPEP